MTRPNDPEPVEVAVRTVVRGDQDYPDGLLELRDAPNAICVRGTLPSRLRSVALVGSRAASPYGRRVAAWLARDLVRHGFVVVSGLARGIDGVAHEAALEAGGCSVAVVPIGLDRILPREHVTLAERMTDAGAVVSEWPANTSPFPGMHVRRNRLIAALAAATIVIEAAERSGALSTARCARALGRPVLAVPGDIDRDTSHGVHQLLRDGARLCTSVADVRAALEGTDGREALHAKDPAPARTRTRPPRGALAPATSPAAEAHGTLAERIRAALDHDPRTAEVIAQRAGVSVGDALAALLELEWAGAADVSAGPRWRVRTA